MTTKFSFWWMRPSSAAASFPRRKPMPALRTMEDVKKYRDSEKNAVLGHAKFAIDPDVGEAARSAIARRRKLERSAERATFEASLTRVARHVYSGSARASKGAAAAASVRMAKEPNDSLLARRKIPSRGLKKSEADDLAQAPAIEDTKPSVLKHGDPERENLEALLKRWVRKQPVILSVVLPAAAVS